MRYFTKKKKLYYENFNSVNLIYMKFIQNLFDIKILYKFINHSKLTLN